MSYPYRRCNVVPVVGESVFPVIQNIEALVGNHGELSF